MFLLEIIAALAGLALFLGAVVAFNRYTAVEYGHRMFRPLTLFVGAASIWSVVGGLRWTLGDAGNGMGLLYAAAGITSLVVITTTNVQRTSLVVGLAGTGCQLLAFSALALAGPIFALPAAMLAIAGAFGGAEPTMRQTHVHHDC